MTITQSITDNKKTILKGRQVIRAINHPIRKEMISRLEDASRMTVTEIYVAMRLEQSVCSQHLAILKAQGVVKTERSGKFIYYSVDGDRVSHILEILKRL